MRELRRPIRLCSQQTSRWKTTTKSCRTPLCSLIDNERFAGWWSVGRTLQLPQSVWVECPIKRHKLRYMSYGTVGLFLAARTRNIRKAHHDSHSYLLVQQYNCFLDVRWEKSKPTLRNHILKLQRMPRFIDGTKTAVALPRCSENN